MMRGSLIKTRIFTGLAIALPLVAVLLLEGLLRAIGVGEVRRHPFQPIPGKSSYVALDPDFGGMFFSGFRPSVAFDPMEAEKRPETLRVIALGGSTTAGFPYSWYYGFPARLEDRLAAALPGRHIEVANLGMTAINSHTLRALAGPILDLQPDAVVIYAGHNEYYGAYGPAGTQGWAGTSLPLKRLLIGASRWALVTGLKSLLSSENELADERRTLMARVVRNSAIEVGSEAYRAGINQFESNLRDALELFEREGIPVFLATLASNLADQAPLGDEREALEAYERGRRQLLAGDTASSRLSFVEAKETDGLRFRAPEAMNHVVRRLAEAFENVTLVDIQESFQAANPGHLEGAALFVDHLHPNARGYALMADAFFEAMREELPTLHESYDAGPASSEVDDIDADHARLQIAVLTNGYPFQKDRTPAQAEAASRASVDKMSNSDRYADVLTARIILEGMTIAKALDTAVGRARQEADTLAALRFYKGLLHWQPFNEGLIDQAVGFVLEDPTYDAQTATLARYASIHTGSTFSLNALAVVYIRQDRLAPAADLLSTVERLDPESPEMLFNRARLLVMQGDTLGARSYFERYRAITHR